MKFNASIVSIVIFNDCENNFELAWSNSYNDMSYFIRDRAPTKINLVKMGIIIEDQDKLCCLCSAFSEDIDHLTCSCSFSYDIWRKCVGWLGFVMVGSNALKSYFIHFPSIRERSIIKKILSIIWQCICWSIWKVRNDAILSGIKRDVDSTVEHIKFHSWK